MCYNVAGNDSRFLAVGKVYKQEKQKIDIFNDTQKEKEF
jgi:hypothetical protein